jgi:hypothetical protein
MVALLTLVLGAGWTLAGCATSSGDGTPEVAVARPKVGECRVLAPEDVAEPTNSSPVVPCQDPHTAETFLVDELPGHLAKADWDDGRLGDWAWERCSTAFQKHLGADESLAMRTVLSWAWFRPTRDAWEEGARWIRCDVVGGGETSPAYLDLPTSTRKLLRPRPDAWLVCVNGPTVEGTKVPCDQPHTWRAVTTIVLGEPEDPYPGDRAVEINTRDFCSKSVAAWLGYPESYDFGYTWFHEEEWSAGNRRSVCWARTDQ